MNRQRVEADFALQYEPACTRIDDLKCHVWNLCVSGSSLLEAQTEMKGSGLSPSEVVAVYIKAEAEQAFYATQCLYPYQELNPHYFPF